MEEGHPVGEDQGGVRRALPRIWCGDALMGSFRENGFVPGKWITPDCRGGFKPALQASGGSRTMRATPHAACPCRQHIFNCQTANAPPAICCRARAVVSLAAP